jgi:pimeloyl-ACP methyl ester carboxylesterase
VLIHGFAASAQLNWGMPGIIDALAKNYHVIALDNRGHGKSGKPHEAEKYGINMVDDVVRLLDHLKIDEAHIVGYSMGGFITTKLITSHPERISSAVIGAAGWHEDAEERLQLTDEIADSLEAGTGIAPLMKALTPEGQPVPSDEQLKATSTMLMLMNDPKALAAAMRGMRNLNVTRTELENNKVPALSIIGGIDPLKDGVDELALVMSNLKVEVIEGADHMTAINNPKLIRSIQDHLQANSAAPVRAASGVGQ